MRLLVNGNQLDLDVAPETPLLWALRDHAGLTGSKFGCGMAQCGACTVQMDGQPVRSCVLPVSAVGEREITTIEGIAADPVGLTVQKVWRELDVAQCGYCQSGQMLAASALLKTKAKPTDADIDQAMSGNICRCATYVRIRAAIHAAATELAAGDPA